MKINNLTVLGAGNMGTAVAQTLGVNGHKVKLWNVESDLEPLEQIKANQENIKYFPGLKLSSNIQPEADLKLALEEAEVVFIVVPSTFFAKTLERAVKFMKKKVVVASLAKGMDEGKMSLLSEIMEKQLKKISGQTVVLSGPAIARDLGQGHFTAMNIAGKNIKAVKKVEKILENDYLKLVPTTDVVGVQLGGVCKNAYALIFGVCDGLELPMNTKAALMAYALREMGIIIKAFGGKKETAFELAGVGDLIGTSFSPHSRNRRCGEHVGKGKKVHEATAAVGQVVEGVKTLDLLLKLAKKKKIKLPLVEMIKKVIVDGKSAKEELVIFLHKTF